MSRKKCTVKSAYKKPVYKELPVPYGRILPYTLPFLTVSL